MPIKPIAKRSHHGHNLIRQIVQIATISQVVNANPPSMYTEHRVWIRGEHQSSLNRITVTPKRLHIYSHQVFFRLCYWLLVINILFC